MTKTKASWDFGNNILYRMCSENPKHDNVEVVKSKIWIIGRCYAADVDRNVPNKLQGEKGGDIQERVARKIVKNNKALDKKIQKLSEIKTISPDNIHILLDTHKFFNDIFYKELGANRVSLASKYIHFHAPNATFIFDSLAKAKIQKLVSEYPAAKKQMAEWKNNIEDDLESEYSVFCFKCLFYLFHTKKNLSPRNLDKFLLGHK